MPTLHRHTDRPGYFARGVAGGKPVAFDLTAEGQQYLTETLGLAEGAKFSGLTLKWLFDRSWAVAIEPPPQPEGGAEAAPEGDGGPAHNPIVFHGVVHIALAAADHVLLDSSADEVVRTLRDSGAIVFGPLPLPARVEAYVVVRDGARHEYPIRQYQRLFQVRQARRRTVEVMNEFHLPGEVEVRVEMK